MNVSAYHLPCPWQATEGLDNLEFDDSYSSLRYGDYKLIMNEHKPKIYYEENAHNCSCDWSNMGNVDNYLFNLKYVIPPKPLLSIYICYRNHLPSTDTLTSTWSQTYAAAATPSCDQVKSVTFTTALQIHNQGGP